MTLTGVEPPTGIRSESGGLFFEFRFAPSQAILGQLEFYESLLSEQFCGLSLLCDQIAFGLPLIARASSFGGELAFFFELGLRELMRPFSDSRTRSGLAE